jgi:hypothetical protein
MTGAIVAAMKNAKNVNEFRRKETHDDVDYTYI